MYIYMSAGINLDERKYAKASAHFYLGKLSSWFSVNNEDSYTEWATPLRNRTSFLVHHPEQRRRTYEIDTHVHSSSVFTVNTEDS